MVTAFDYTEQTNTKARFEIALMLQKLAEDYLTTDVRNNFVEHFYTGQQDRFKPGCCFGYFSI